MSEFRRDAVSNRWVIVAPERAARPTDFPVERRTSSGGFCLFCEGNEDKTPPEVDSLRNGGSEPDGPGWRVRVVPNKFPALRSDAGLAKRGDGLFASMNGLGVHEVIVDTPLHVACLSELGPPAVEDVLSIYARRMREVKRNRHLACAMLFKNVGVAAGASLEHSHSQMIAMPVAPPAICAEMEGARRFLEAHGECVFCRMIEWERDRGERMIAENAHFTAFAPFASRFPFETWILPRQHRACFEEHPADTLGDLADLMYTVLSMLEVVLDRPAYNYIVHTAPFESGAATSYHWHIEIMPRMTRVAGFEWGTGLYINPVAPESAAAALQEPRRAGRRAEA